MVPRRIRNTGHQRRVHVGGFRNGGQNGFGKAPEETASDHRRTSDPTQPLGDQMGQNVERNLVGEPQRLVPATECEFRRGLIR